MKTEVCMVTQNTQNLLFRHSTDRVLYVTLEAPDANNVREKVDELNFTTD